MNNPTAENDISMYLQLLYHWLSVFQCLQCRRHLVLVVQWSQEYLPVSQTSQCPLFVITPFFHFGITGYERHKRKYSNVLMVSNWTLCEFECGYRNGDSVLSFERTVKNRASTSPTGTPSLAILIVGWNNLPQGKRPYSLWALS